MYPLLQVFTGLLRVGRRDLDTRDDCIHLLVNEMARVFYDRCFPEDRDKILNIFHEGLRIYFKVSIYLSCLNSSVDNSMLGSE